MKVQLFTTPQRFVVLDEFLTPDEWQAVYDEVLALEPHLMAGQVLRDGVALTSTKKRNHNIWLDDQYQGRRKASPLLRMFDEKYRSDEVKQALEATGDLLFEYAQYANADCTLLSVYKPGDYYGDHMDEVPGITVNYMLCSTPKAFTGGDFYLADNSAFYPDRKRSYTRVEFVNNRLVVFPSRAYHYVDAVQAPADLPYRQSRFTAQYWAQYYSAKV